MYKEWLNLAGIQQLLHERRRRVAAYMYCELDVVADQKGWRAVVGTRSGSVRLLLGLHAGADVACDDRRGRSKWGSRLRFASLRSLVG